MATLLHGACAAMIGLAYLLLVNAHRAEILRTLRKKVPRLRWTLDHRESVHNRLLVIAVTCVCAAPVADHGWKLLTILIQGHA